MICVYPADCTDFSTKGLRTAVQLPQAVVQAVDFPGDLFGRPGDLGKGFTILERGQQGDDILQFVLRMDVNTAMMRMLVKALVMLLFCSTGCCPGGQCSGSPYTVLL